jgi:hypothetical protein
MSNKNIEQFIATYGPVAMQVSKEINVDPNVLLSQWGLESRWGQTDMAKKHHNLGGVKDFSGKGFEAKDNQTGTIDKYVKFEDPEVFGMYYVDQIKRNFPNAINAGPDVGAFARGLASGKKGSYFEKTPEEYEKSLSSFQSAIPESKMLPFEPLVQPAEKQEEQSDGVVLVDAPPPPPPTKDKSGASPAERFLFGGIGTGAGMLSTGAQGLGARNTAAAVKRAGAEETARIAAQRAAGVTPPATPSTPSTPGAPASGGQSIMRQPGASPTGFNLQPPVGPADAGRMAKGQTGAQVYNYAKSLGLPDIEAARALSNTSKAGGAHNINAARVEGLNRIQSLFPGETYVENPRYGGVMTTDQGVGRGPRESFSMKAPVAPSPDLPLGQPGGLSQLPPRQPISTAPKPPSIMSQAMSGLESVNGMFRNMMKPVATVGKYALAPLAGLSAGLDVAEVAHEYDKPENQRDYLKMGLKGVGALSGVASMVPGPHQLVTVPVSLGASAIQAYREDPEFYNQKLKEYTGISP